MQTVKAPLHLGYQGVDVHNLQEIFMYFIQNEILVLDDETILNSYKEEYDKMYFGTTTAILVRQFIAQNELTTDRGILVTDEVAELINSTYLSSIDGLERIIFGKITNKNNKPLSGYTVTAYDKDLRTNERLNTATTDAKGNYRITYSLADAANKENKTADIFISVSLPDNSSVSSDVYYNVGTIVLIDLAVTNDSVTDYISEYDEIKAKVLALIPTGQTLDSLTEADLEFLSKELCENTELIRIFILAQQFRLIISSIVSDVFYGLMRQNLPKKYEPLISTNSDSLKSALQLSVGVSIIQHYTSAQINNFVTQLLNATSSYVIGTKTNTVANAKTYKILSVALSDTKMTTFLNYYTANKEKTDFWAGQMGLDTNEIKNVQNTLTNAILTGNNPAMVNLLTKNGNTFIQPQTYVAKTIDDWLTYIDRAKATFASDFLIPSIIVGSNETEKRPNYALYLKSNYDSAFAIDTLNAEIEGDTSDTNPFKNFKASMGTFVSHNPSFNIINTPSISLKREGNEFNFTGIPDNKKDDFIEEIAIIQRLCNLTSDYSLMKLMANQGLTSSKKIGRMSIREFATAIGVPEGNSHGASSGITMASANVLYSNAEKINMVSASLIGELNSYLHDGFDMILTQQKRLSLMPDLETLFGSLDYCACTHCRSVYSPSAYLVDTLELLHKYNSEAYNRLNEKRSDLWNLKLSCENANKVLPYIDLTNELLEDLLNPSAQLSSYTLNSRNTTLNEKQLRAFPEYLSTEYGTTGKGPYKTVLYKSVYPWNIPFNYFKEQIDEFLTISETNEFDVAKAFSVLSTTDSFNDIDSTYRFLSLSKEEYRIITGQPVYIEVTGNTSSTLPAATLSDFWGVYHDLTSGSLVNGKITNPKKGATPILLPISTPLASFNSQTQFNLVNVFLQQAQLTFNDLLELLDCYFVNQIKNPTATSLERRLSIENITGSSPVTDCCDINKLWIKGLNENDLDKIHRFVRLKNKLGLSFYEMDRLLITVNVELGNIPNTLNNSSFTANTLYDPNTVFPQINGDVIKRIAQIVKISKQLNTSIDSVLFFFDSIQYNQYSSYSNDNPVLLPTQFELLFRNKAVTDITVSTYPFPTSNPFSTQFPIQSGSSTLIGVNLEIVLSAFGISKDDYQYLIAYFASSSLSNVFVLTGGNLNFTLKNLTHLYREVILANNLGIKIPDWCQYRLWLIENNVSLSPFDDSLKTLKFLEKLKIIRNSGLTIENLNYIFYSKFPSLDSKNKLEKELLGSVQQLRDSLFSLSTYQAELDSDGEILLKRLEYITTNEIAKSIVTILKEDNITSTSFATQDLSNFDAFINSPNHYPFAIVVLKNEINEKVLGSPIGTPTANTIIAVNDRLQYFFNIAIKSILIAQVRNFITTKFLLEQSTADELLNALIEEGSNSGYITCINDTFIGTTGDFNLPISGLNPPEIIDVFNVFSKVNKTTTLINAYQLNIEDVRIFSSYNVELDINLDIANLVTPTSPITEKWIQFVDWIHLRAQFDRSNKPLLSIIIPTLEYSGSSTNPLKEDWVTDMMLAFGISQVDLEVLVGDKTIDTVTPSASTNVLAMDFANSTYSQLISKNYWKLLECFEMQSVLEASMSDCNSIGQKIISPSSNLQNDADLVINLMKSKYGDDAWLNVLKPINDRLRVKRRDAMVSYLLGNPCFGFKGIWRTSNDLFEQLLIDTEMMPCMLTSRTRQAISVSQLFIDRCMLTLEVYNNLNIILTPETGRQWNLWRKFYRVWEANRKVFLYPENWIEPDLRDNKSPFFVDLEKFLKQNEITKENVEEAYKTYLERLDEVSHLDPVAIYAEEATGVVNAWGRTKAQPHIYYHRMKSENEWTPWVKMEVQIDGDHFVPVMWRGRLKLYWLVFTEQVDDTKPTKFSLDEEMILPEKYWKIELAWSEFKNSRWQPKQIGKEFHRSSKMGVWNEGAIRWNFEHPQTKGVSGYWWDMVTMNTPETIKKCMQFVRDNMTFYCKKNEEGDLEFVLTENIKCITPEIVYAQIPITNSVSDPGFSWLNAVTALFSDNADNPSPNFLRGHIGKFTVKHNGIFADILQWGQYWYYANYYHEYLSGVQNGIGYLNFQTGYEYRKDITLGYTHDPDENYWKLLNRAPGYEPRVGKYVLFQRQIPFTQADQSSKINFHKFFYRDYRNSFYVERTNDKIKYASNALGAGSLGQVNVALTAGIQSAVDEVFTAAPGSLANAGASLSEVNLFTDYPSKYYRFFPFYHYTVNEMSKQLFDGGLDSFFDFNFIQQQSLSSSTEVIHFSTEYKPTQYVDSKYPTSYIDYSIDGAYSLYNWELFFHIPMLIANRLMQNQKFFDARQWFHYVFNPTSTRQSVTANNDTDKFWNFIPFNLHAQDGIPTILEIMSGTLSVNTQKAIDKWAQNPFKPHLVARTRIGAYMRNTVMKYLDNLIAWGDQLFRQDTMESINEATLMYILASQILGRRPYKIPERLVTSPKTYTELQVAGLNAFSNAQVAVESILMPTGVTPTVVNMSMDYFCIPPNDKLLGYWDIVGDRLFKIRHCQNIDGTERSLALFEPPIDPALLVKAASMGISISDAVNDVLSPLPQYRFSVMMQKATELAQEVKSMGSALLAALEKKDSEKISLLRSSHELNILEAVKELKELQIHEAMLQIETLNEQKKITQFKKDYYNTLIEKGLNQHEELQLDSLKLSIPLKYSQSIVNALGAIFHAIPNAKLGAPTSMGITYGGDNLGSVQSQISMTLGIAAGINDIIGSMAGIKGSFARRKEEWSLQNKLADKELIQIDKQIVSAEIRKSITQKELSNHELQMKQTLEMDEVMHSKFTNEELYDWMIGEISLTYFQTYNLAVDVAKRAERCYNYDLGTEKATGFINFGYWNSLKKGLLAGDNLLFDIKRMDIAYLEQNKRQHELTKHVSLSSFSPEGLMQFKKNKKLDELEFPEWLFDMDYPGHYFRRIKSISVSIPCIAGPYTTVSCKLTLNHSKYRTSPVILGAGYVDDLNYKTVFSGGESIATSNAQNDSGMFELNFRDERYLPFEGAGVISNWKLEIPSKYAQFDINTISDVIFHIKYTSRFDGGLTNTANSYLEAQIVSGATTGYLPRIFSLKNEFANEWNKYIDDLVGNPSATLDIKLSHEMFPYFCSLFKPTTTTVFDIELLKGVVELQTIEGENIAAFNLSSQSTLGLTFSNISSNANIQNDDFSSGTKVTKPSHLPISFTISNTSVLSKVRDIQFAVIYKLS